jgi:outer membrane lipoprotein-sorting protein
MGAMTQWIARELNYPIKILYEGQQGKMTMEYKNIKQGGLSDTLFSVPSDYQKMSMPGMTGGPPSGR